MPCFGLFNTSIASLGWRKDYSPKDGDSFKFHCFEALHGKCFFELFLRVFCFYRFCKVELKKNIQKK
jgi:hypothetical protein